MNYIDNIRTALMLFPLIAAVITVPYAIYQYRKFGSIPWWKSTLVFSFAFYMLCAYFMVILPLPADRSVVVPYAAHPQMVPFDFISSMSSGVTLDPSSAASWISWLRSPYVYTVLFNVLLTLPFGFFVRYLFNRPLWQAFILGFALSLFFEVSQLTGLFGIYEHAYRLFDVDDLIMNTVGALLGYLVSVPLTRFLPNIERMNASAIEKGEHHTALTRRVIAFGIDLLLVVGVIELVDFLLPNTFIDEVGEITLKIIGTGVVFVLIPVLLRARTLGQLVLRMHVVKPDGTSAPWYAVALRYALLFWGFLLAPQWVSMLVTAPAIISPSTHEYVMVATALQTAVQVTQVIWLLTVLGRAIASAFGKPFVMLNGVITNTRVLGDTQIDHMRAEAHRPSLEEEEGDGDLGATVEDAFDDTIGSQFDDPTDEK